MLSRLIINNIALIDHLEIDFRGGFNVLTGETGAGKSIIIDAVNLAIGARANRDLIRNGASKASVEATFSVEKNKSLTGKLDEYCIEAQEGELVIAREIMTSGKQACRINGTLVSLVTLKDITQYLIDIHGQHEHQSLLNSENHLIMIDDFVGEKLYAVKEAVGKYYGEYTIAKSRLAKGFMEEGERARRIDVLTYQVNEIDNANLAEGEDDALEEERELLSNAEKIMASLNAAHQALEGDEQGALSPLHGAIHAISNISTYAKPYSQLCARLESIFYELEDITATIKHEESNFEYNPERLNEVLNRLDTINTLKRKYGGSIAQVLSFSKNAGEKLLKLQNQSQDRLALEELIESTLAKYLSAARALTLMRREGAQTLATLILEQLNDLGLEKAKLEARFKDIAPTSSGIDDVEFYLTANQGEALRPLSKVASGGEMSRIMLAFKVVISDIDSIGTMIFDEIDTGVSGRIASIVGEKMIEVSRKRQVICITHLAQIAAMADSHFLVQKTSDGITTSTKLTLLEGESRVNEVAKIMGADAIEDKSVAIDHARALIDKAKQRANL